MKSISRPVIDRLPVNQLDEFACRQLDRVRARSSCPYALAPHIFCPSALPAFFSYRAYSFPAREVIWPLRRLEPCARPETLPPHPNRKRYRVMCDRIRCA